MSVGGSIIEIIPYTLRDDRGARIDVDCVRIWVIDSFTRDEMVVYAERGPHMPCMGQEVWWQNGKIFFDNDKRFLKKIGPSHKAPTA